MNHLAEPLDPTLIDTQESIKANEDLPVRVKCMVTFWIERIFWEKC